MRLQQAIFTSVRSTRLDGYQLAATSSGINEAVAKELTIWGPAHDSLWDTRHDARSVNFHPLATGEFCISCTTLAGAEYSGRGGGRVYSQMFVVPREALERFAWDPFLILRALSAAGRLVVHDTVPESLPTVPLLGRSDKPDESLTRQVIDEIGAKVFSDVVEAVATCRNVAVLTSGHVERLYQAILHSFAPEHRVTISFTTNLKDSARRPFKLFVLPNDPTIVRQSTRLNGARVVDLVGEDVRGSARLSSVNR
jgi:3'-phosphoadenosine 5'-phosphosulfate sulfotransferase